MQYIEQTCKAAMLTLEKQKKETALVIKALFVPCVILQAASLLSSSTLPTASSIEE